MSELPQHIVSLIVAYRYPLLVVLAFIEGPILMMLCGFLVKLGLLSALPTFLSLSLGDLIGDVAWYYIGYYLGYGFVHRWGKYFGISDKNIATVTRIFHRYHNRILLISKATLGLGFSLVTLITAGIVRIPIFWYVVMNAVGEIFFVGALMIIGFYFGQLYGNVHNDLARLSIFALFAVVFVCLLGFGRFMRDRFLASDKPDEINAKTEEKK